MDPLDAVLACGGAARTARLLTMTPRRSLAAAVRSGELRRPAPGLFATPDVEPDLLAAVALRGVRSCHTAAAALGFDLVDPPARPHVTCPRGSRGSWPGTTVHRRTVRDLDGCTDPLTTVLDCLRCLPGRFALVPVDSALRQDRVSLDELHEAAAAMNRNDPRRHLVAWADPDCGSPLESVARYDLLEAGFSVRTQRVLDPAGRVDFVIDGWLVVEVDGFRFHADPAQRSEDLRRDVELRRLGLQVLRFSWEQVVRQREWWLQAVRDVHARGRRAA